MRFLTKTRLLLMAAAAFAVAGPAVAQQTLSLEQALQIARENNVRLRQARHNATMASVDHRIARADYLPQVNANLNANRRFGTTFDPTLFQMTTRPVTTSSPSLSAQMVLFDGFSKYFTLRQTRSLAEAGKQNQAQAELLTEANVTGYYLLALNDRESMKISKERMDLLTGQLTKMERLEQAGVKTEEDVYLLRSQIANEKLTYLNLENSHRQNMLLLLQELNTEPGQAYTLQTPELATATANRTPASIDSIMQKAFAGFFQ